MSVPETAVDHRHESSSLRSSCFHFCDRSHLCFYHYYDGDDSHFDVVLEKCLTFERGLGAKEASLLSSFELVYLLLRLSLWGLWVLLKQQIVENEMEIQGFDACE